MAINETDLAVEGILRRLDQANADENPFITGLDQIQINSQYGEQFDDNDSSYPDGWTEVDAADITNTDDLAGYWLLRGHPSETTWNYRKQITHADNSVYGTSWFGVQFNNIFFRDGDFTADLRYTFGLAANSSGAPSADDYQELHIEWDSTNEVWNARGHSRVNATNYYSSWKEIAFPIPFPLFVRLTIFDIDSVTIQRSAFGCSPLSVSQSLLISTAGDSHDWEEPWVYLELSRGAGNADFLYIDGMDFTTSA